jgi:hypothetical protein
MLFAVLEQSDRWPVASVVSGLIRNLKRCRLGSRSRSPSMMFPAAVPEVPVSSIDKAATHYVDVFGFTLDWGDEQGGIAGISRGGCRLFLTNLSFREHHGNLAPVLFWVNLESKCEVDELFGEWKQAHATIISGPEDKPWKLREFLAADLDGNLIRVFYDFRADI